MKKLEAKRKLSRFNFEASGSHVALVGPRVGGAANQWTTLLTKSTDDITPEQVEESLSQVDKDMSSDEGVTNPTEGKTLSESVENKEEHMSEDMIAKSVYEADIAKAVEEAVAKAVEEKEVEKAEAVATKQAELDAALAIVKSFEDKEKESVAKSRKEALKQAGVAEEEVESLYKSCEALDTNAFEIVVKAMAAKSKAIDESDIMKETGVSGESVAVELDGVAALTKSLQEQYTK